jgi:allophanate hydrolase
MGVAIEVEVWRLPPAAFADFVAGVPQPLAIGSITLEDGQNVPGFLVEPSGLENAVDISTFGGWRNYLKSTTLERTRQLPHGETRAPATA